MKAFDLKAAQEGAAVVTRDGQAVRVICYDRKNNAPIVALVTREQGGREEERCLFFDAEGNCKSMSDDARDNDLFMKPQEVSGWVAVFEVAGKTVCGSTICATEEEAKAYSSQKMKVGEAEAVCLGICEIKYKQ